MRKIIQHQNLFKKGVKMKNVRIKNINEKLYLKDENKIKGGIYENTARGFRVS